MPSRRSPRSSEGLHVLSEKPLDVTTAKVDSVIDAADRAGVKVGVFFQDRLKPDIASMKQMIVSGKLGKPIFIAGHVRWYRPPEYYATSKWRGSWALDGGGALMNQAIHTVDVLQWLFGPVARVAGRTGNAAPFDQDGRHGRRRPRIRERRAWHHRSDDLVVSGIRAKGRRQRIGGHADPGWRQARRGRSARRGAVEGGRGRAAARERGVSDGQRQRAASADLRGFHPGHSQQTARRPATRARRARAWRLSKRSTDRRRAGQFEKP